MSDRDAGAAAIAHLVGRYSSDGRRIGALMPFSILIEAWDLHAIGYVLIFICAQYHPSPAMLGPRRRARRPAPWWARSAADGSPTGSDDG